MADILSGLGGLFGGFSQGLQLLYTLQQAAEDRRIRQQQADTSKGQLDLEREQFGVEQANAPYKDIQSQLNKANVTAPLPDIRREYTPPAIGDTFQPTNEFQPPEFGGSGLAPQRPSAPVVQDLNTSHIAQVLERAKRQSGFQRGQSVLSDVLAAAGQRAQQTQQPVSGAFPDKTGATAELPSGFTAQPERTFSPYQLSQGSNREAERIATAIRLLRSRIPPKALNLLDVMGMKPGEVAKVYPGAQADIRHLIELQAQYERLVGAVNPGGGQGQLGAPKDRDQLIQSIIQVHPNWTDQQIADEVDRQMATP